VQTEHIIDVRGGQKSDGFDKYPYEEMERQSFSVFVEEEKQSNYYKRCDAPRLITSKL